MYKRLVMKNLHLQDVNPRVCGLRDCTPGFTVGPNIRDHWILHFVLSGKGTFVHNTLRFDLQAGDVFAVHPGDMTAYIADEKEPWSYIWAAFDASLPIAELISFPVMKAPWASSLFSRISTCDQHAAPEWTVCSLLHEFLAILAQQRDAAARPSTADYINRALNDIHSNYDQPLRIAEVASNLGLDRHYFCRLFHQQVGLSPQAYLLSYRLEKAAELLTVHQLSQKETAQLVGYSDVAAFSKMFKSKYGVTPGSYQKASQQRCE